MRPPMSSDSEEDDYDGFSFGNEFEKKPKSNGSTSSQWFINQQRESDDLSKLVLYIKNGDLDGLKRELLRLNGSESQINYNKYLKDGWTLMLHAVSHLQTHIVNYLINKEADINCEADSLTPLMVICKQEAYPSQMDALSNMTKLLLEHGAVVNVRDKTGYTPFMYACTSGNIAVVELLLNLSAVDAVDNFGNTPLHYAVQNNHFDVVQMLINAGVDIEVSNSAGLKPRDLAASLGLTEIEQLFPEEIIDVLPVSADQYRTYHDLNPLIFPDHKKAAYSQDIPRMLRGMRAENCAMQFYNANISLAEFLTIDDSRLQEIGVEYEFQRKRILHGLLKFHQHQFSKKSVEMTSKIKHKNMYQLFEMYACNLKHFIMLESAVDYLWKFGALKNVHQGTFKEMLASLDVIRNDILVLQECVQQISVNSTKNPLFIGSTTNQNQRYKQVFGPFLKYTMLIGMGIFFSYRLYKLLP